MRDLRFGFAVATLLATAGTAMAGFSTGPQAGPLDSEGAAGAVANGVYTFNHAGPAFTPGNFRFTGTLTSNASGTFSSEARWRVIAPSGQTFTMTTGLPTSTAGTFTTFNATNVSVNTGGAFLASNSVGNWTFRSFDSANDGGATVDARWTNYSFDFDDFVLPTPPAGAQNLGTLAPGGMLMAQTPYVSNTVQWYKFTLGTAIPAGDQFAAHTFGNTLIGGQFAAGDTEIAIFNALGNVIGNNDDNPNGAWSLISNTTGLAAGDYYVAASAYNLTVGAGFTATVADFVPTGGSVTGDIKLTIIPTPSALAVLGLGGLIATRRRRA